MGFITLSSILLLPFKIWQDNSARAEEFAKIAVNDHTYTPGSKDNRGPCPALNALANHAYLPRDGENISIPRLEAAMMAGLNMTKPLSITLAAAVRPVINLHPSSPIISLKELRIHDLIEHDSSFTRLDHRDGDQYTFQPELFARCLADAHDGPISLSSLAHSRTRRDREHKESGGAPLPWSKLSNKWTEIAAAPATLGTTISKEDAIAFFAEERIPDRLLRPAQTPPTNGVLRLLCIMLIIFVKSFFVKLDHV